MKPFPFLLVCAVIVSLLFGVNHEAARAQSPVPLRAFRFENGLWFDGTTFQKQTFYSVNGLLTRKMPPSVDETLDLKGGYVVPPFGDAHCHHFEYAVNIAGLTQTYLRDGIFYAMVPGNSLQGAREIYTRVNLPTGVDVQWANGCLTGDNSHPIPVYEGVTMGYYTSRDQFIHRAEILKNRKRADDCYFIVDTKSDLERKWPLILAGKPNFIKVILLHSENYQQRKQKTGYGEGIDPALLPEIVKRAHAAGLRVAAHVDSAFDHRVALESGVDIMAHLCGYFMEEGDAIETYQITPTDAALTAKKRVAVIPTANRAGYLDEVENKERARANQIRNLSLLKKAGVTFGIGADDYGRDALEEALYLRDLGIWSNLEMLRMWCEDTPRLIFPRRKIGRLREGYEASFLVLDKNPLEAFSNTQTVRLRCKQGVLLNLLEEGGTK